MIISSPCKDCEKSGCGLYHSECEKYLEYRAEVDKQNELIKEYKKEMAETCSYINQQQLRTHRSGHKVKKWRRTN